MIEMRTAETITAIGRDRWQSLFPGELESYDYLLAVEEANLDGFTWCYVMAWEDERLLAAAPGFITQYPLDTTLAAAGKLITQQVRRVAPRALSLQLSCLGSPCTETALLGFADGLNGGARTRLLQILVEGFERDAKNRGSSLIAVKDVAETSQVPWDDTLRSSGYIGIPGLPTAHLDINFATIEEYLFSLSSGTRKDMRRKLRVLEQVRIEWRSNLDDVLNRILELYRGTLARAEMRLEELTPAFFQFVLKRMGAGAVCALYFAGDELLAFNLLLKDDTTLLDKFFCMDAGLGRDYNLYFLSWFTNVDYCLERGLSLYRSGQAAYENKVRLGSVLTRTTMYARHRNPVLNRALRLAAPLFSADSTVDQSTPRRALRKAMDRECERA